MNRSLEEKSSARLAAVQLLYKAAMTGEKPNPERMATDYQHFLEENKDAPKEAHLSPVPPSMAYLKKLLSGVTEHAGALEPWVEKCLTADWKKERMSPLLLAILRLGVFEIAHFRTLKPAILINEYVSLTGRFFGEAETGFVNASLNKVAAEMRSDDER